MKPSVLRLARILHRDLGYFFFGATIAYAVSGLAINHRRDWNPSYRLEQRSIALPPGAVPQSVDRETALGLLRLAEVSRPYRQHYAPAPNQLRVFFDGGTATLDRPSGTIHVEELTRRPVLHFLNRLHYNPGRWWTWYSDAFAGALIVVAITGLVLLRGHHGIARRGGLLVGAGIALPLALALCHL
jgi:hypothetical protein